MFITLCIINIVLCAVYFGYAASNGTKIFISLSVSDTVLIINKLLLIATLFITLTNDVTTKEITAFMVQCFISVLFYIWLYFTKYN